MTADYTIFEVATGRILRTLQCEAADLSHNTGVGESAIDGAWPNDGWRIVDGAPVAMPPRPSRFAAFDFAAGEWVPVPPSADLLAVIRARAVARINAAAGAKRAQYITDITGQDMLYARKAERAAQWVADPAPDVANYPLIAREVGVTAETPEQVVQVWLNLGAAWEYLAGVIEQLRLTAIDAVRVEVDPELIEGITTQAEADIAGCAP